MRDPARIDRIVEKLRTTWKKYPDLRLGQFVVVLSRESNPGIDTFYTEDGPIEKALDKRLAGIVKE